MNDRPDSDHLARVLAEREEALAEADQLRERAHEAELAAASAKAELKVRLEQLDGLKAELATWPQPSGSAIRFGRSRCRGD